MKLRYFSICVASALVMMSCKKEVTTTPGSEFLGAEKEQVKETYANIAFAVYSDSYTSAVLLQTAINSFVAAPSQGTLDAAKQAWLDAREVYGLSEVFRFVDGPIDNPDNGPEGLINAWPMDEAYVDYTQDDASSGIINDPVNYPVIDATTIINANEFGSETNISCGYHAIEFLLWGQDLSAASAGTRPYTDYVVGGTASNQLRRGQYLSACAQILVDALDQVKDAWDPAVPSSFYYTFIDQSNSVALRQMFTSMKSLSGFELAGERMYVAYSHEDQEDEHSCFSDNTHRDIFLNAQGIFNLYVGYYDSPFANDVDGFSLSDLVNIKNATKNSEMTGRLTTSRDLIEQMYTPFDQAIILPAERPKVLLAIQSLQAEADLFVEVASTLSITI